MKRHINTIPNIIHLFAIAHASVTLLCRISGINDTLFLTLLTMLMTVIICMKKNLAVETTAVCVILVNIAGYLLGIGGGQIFNRIMSYSPIAHAIASTITTEVMGWSIHGFSSLFKTEEKRRGWSSQFKWIVVACIIIFFLRLAYGILFSHLYDSTEEIYQLSAKCLSNVPVLLTVICLNLIYLRTARHFTDKKGNLYKTASLIIVVVFLSLFMSVCVGLNLPFGFNETFSTEDIGPMFLVTLIIEVTLYSCMYLIDYATMVRNDMIEQTKKAELAEFQYYKFKQQLNPHFLFNSLNILDCLVQEERTSQASRYIHKLANIYRYMLSNENNDIVSLKEEMDFVGMYTDLLKVRFSDGFITRIDIREEDMSKMVIPCSVQLLVENAIKHNAVGTDKPLIIEISSDGENLKVNNNICPKMTTSASTGVGLKYIGQEYRHRSTRTIETIRTETTYTVILPLLEKQGGLTDIDQTTTHISET